MVPHPGGNFLGITEYIFFHMGLSTPGFVVAGGDGAARQHLHPRFRLPTRFQGRAGAGKPHGVKFPEIPSAGVSAPITSVKSRYPADGR